MACRGCNAGCSCPLKLIRFTADGLMEVSTDGGLTWSPATTEDPRNNAPTSPPLPGEDGEDKRCNAAEAGVQALMQTVTDFAAELLATPNLQTIINFLLTTLGVFVGALLPAMAVLAPLLVGLLVLFVAMSPSVFTAAFTTDVWDRLRCNLFCNMSDDASFTEAQFTSVLAQLGIDETAIAYNWLTAVIRALGPRGLTNVVRSSEQVGDCSECNCSEFCGVIVNIGTLVSQTDNVWVIDSEVDAGLMQINISIVDDSLCGHCAFLTAFTAVPAVIDGGAYNDCDAVNHGVTPPVNSCFADADWYATSGTPFTATITLGVCPP